MHIMIEIKLNRWPLWPTFWVVHIRLVGDLTGMIKAISLQCRYVRIRQYVMASVLCLRLSTRASSDKMLESLKHLKAKVDRGLKCHLNDKVSSPS